jgi:hypothetical protein
MAMPIVRYIAWVGTSLVALLLVVNWLIPLSEPEPVVRTMEKPVIRITSVRQLPERIDIDASQPTIVRPRTLLIGDTVPPLMEAHPSTTKSPPIVEVDKKRQKVAKRKGPKVAAKQLSLPSIALVTSGPVRSAPLTKVSFADIVSGRLVKSMLNLR